ncbi:vWA domain-containing protein [Yoonia sp. SS1-5]|uniref:VWA domain-containing protein n=1 Tax=Yoonia rhodophyticola TaxID=3137370 RepID=A0AAN0MC22_9RHOB
MAAIVAAGLAFAAPFAEAAPLLVDGKQTVYQRVLTRPDVSLYDAQDGAVQSQFTPFEPLYVFERTAAWLQVGRSASGEPMGWVKVEDVVDWNQNIVAAFTNPANRTRQIMFDTLDDLYWLMNHEAVIDLHPQLVTEIDAGSVRDGRGIVGVEPPEFIDIQGNFYIMPILDFTEDLHPLSAERNLMMEVATIPLEESDGGAGLADPFDVGVVFVIDTTASMDVHFPVVQAQVQDLVNRIAGSDVGSRVNFGIVAFRDDTSGDYDALEYRVREVLPLERRADQTIVVDTLGGLEDAGISSPGVSEDSFSAVSYALQDVDWSGGGRPFGGKYIVLITDAAPKLPGQSGGTNARDTYDFTAQDLQATAEALGTGIIAIHLKTATAGEANHQLAETQYDILTSFGGTSHYSGIEGGSADALAAETDRIVTFVKDEVLRADGATPEQSDDDTGTALLELGNELRLRYLGQQRGTAAPDIVRSWVSQLGVDDPRREAMSFRLLVTRNELATMADLLDEFYNIGNTFQDDTDIEDFHTNIREAIVRLAQNPERVINPSAERSGDALEFLSDLPYRSQLLRMSADFWIENPGQRRVILDGLNSKKRSYQRWLTTPDVWVPLYEGAPDSEWVTALPIEFLP